MSGKRYLLDTNAIIFLLADNQDIFDVVQEADWLGISIISQLEFLAFSGLSQNDQDLFKQFVQRVNVIDLSSKQPLLIDKIIEIRKQYRLKLPDAIIAASAIQSSSILITADKAFQKVETIKLHLLTESLDKFR